MKIAVVCDSFKGSLTSKDACAAVKDGLLRCNKNFEVLSLPFADGGEGTSRCFTIYSEGSFEKRRCTTLCFVKSRRNTPFCPTVPL